jgi:RecA/RadA recombinase
MMMAVAPDLILPSGVLPLDYLLDGGLHTGLVTHVYGEAASGKTTMGLHFVNSACKSGLRVMYVNSESSSVIERLEQITGRKFSEIQDMVRILVPKGFAEQGVLIDELDLYAREGTRLVVVDTLTRLYRTVLENKDATYAAHRELNRQTGFLKGLAKQKDIAILILNQVRGGPDSHDALEPVAKNILDYWADSVVWIRLSQKRTERIIELVRPEREHRTAVLYVTSAGLASTSDLQGTAKLDARMPTERESRNV